MRDYKIDKNIPAPNADTWYTFLSRLEIGDSFIVTSRAEACTAWAKAKRANIRLTLRQLEDGTKRIWRIK